MGYILFLSKHHDGFCLWDTETTDKKVTNSALGIDVGPNYEGKLRDIDVKTLTRIGQWIQNK